MTRTRREEAIGAKVTEPSVVYGEGVDPEGEAVLADSAWRCSSCSTR